MENNNEELKKALGELKENEENSVEIEENNKKRKKKSKNKTVILSIILAFLIIFLIDYLGFTIIWGIIPLAMVFSLEKNDKKRIILNFKSFIAITITTGIIFFCLVYMFAILLGGDDKPIIYLYPTSETEVTVKLNKSEQITCSYPKYKNEWKVIAEPNGDLTYEETGRKLYSLYYESNNTIKFNVEKEGFVVKGEDTAEFLEEKLALLGLTEREAEEFIVYWLPKLEANKYNYIRFATKEEIEENNPLEINPKPDTLIRVLMTYKGLNKSIEVEEQKLETPERTGFVAVEWGGTEIK